MKYAVKRFKTPHIALKELEPFIRAGDHIETGRPFARFGGMRSREATANWLLCAAYNAAKGWDCLTFTSDPVGGDGVLVDQQTGETWRTEHVMVPNRDNSVDLEDRIINAVSSKQAKGGLPYAQGKTLVVFLNAGGQVWFPDKLVCRLPDPLHFDAVWVIGLERVEDGEYVYNVVLLDGSTGSAPAVRVHIAKDFGDWHVEGVR